MACRTDALENVKESEQRFDKILDNYKQMFYNCFYGEKENPSNYSNGVAAPLIRQVFSYQYTNPKPKRPEFAAQIYAFFIISYFQMNFKGYLYLIFLICP